MKFLALPKSLTNYALEISNSKYLLSACSAPVTLGEIYKFLSLQSHEVCNVVSAFSMRKLSHVICTLQKISKFQSLGRVATHEGWALYHRFEIRSIK